MTVTVTPRKDPSTNSVRSVIGDQRLVSGTLKAPQAKYITDGFAITPKELGFDKAIRFIEVGFQKGMAALAGVQRISDQEWKLQFFSSVSGTQLASENESMNGIEVPFFAIGE